jgi:hypothetical protein
MGTESQQRQPVGLETGLRLLFLCDTQRLGVDGVLVKRHLLTYVYSNLHDSLAHRSRTGISRQAG